MKYSMFIGRYQPLHKGHIALINKVLDEGKPVLIALRDTPISKDNPFSVEERKTMFLNEFGSKIKIITIPDIAEVVYGRKVGWGIRQIELSEELESISATKIRNDLDNRK